MQCCRLGMNYFALQGNPRLPAHNDLTDIVVNIFRNTEKKPLQQVRNKDVLDLSKLPTEELRTIYGMDALIPYVDSILLGYWKKIVLLEMVGKN